MLNKKNLKPHAMKNHHNAITSSAIIFISLALLSIFFTACVDMRFEVKQPVNTVSLTQFPSDLQGKYIDSDCDTLMITECCLYYGNINSNFSSDFSELEKDVFELTQLDGDYFLNLKVEEHWQVLFIKMGEQSFSAYYIDIDSLTDDNYGIDNDAEKEKQVIERIGKITKVRRHKVDDEYYYLINPSIEQLKKLISAGVFVKIDDFKQV